MAHGSPRTTGGTGFSAWVEGARTGGRWAALCYAERRDHAALYRETLHGDDGGEPSAGAQPFHRPATLERAPVDVLIAAESSREYAHAAD